MSEINVGRPLVTLQKPGTGGGGGGNTPIQITGALITLLGNIANGFPITVNLVDSLGNPIPNGPISQLGNTFEAEVVDVTPISVNTVPQGNITNWQNIEIDVDDKNGNPITPIITKVGNTLNLDIAGTTPAKVNATNLTPLANWDLITVNVKNKNGVTIAPGISQSGNTVDLSIAGTTPVDVNAVNQGTFANWDLISINVTDVNNNTVTPTITKAGNTMGLKIAGNSPLQINATPAGFLANWTLVSITVADKNGVPVVFPALSYVITGNSIAFTVAGTTPAKVNATNLTALANWDLVTVNVKDKNGVTISPTISQAGNTVDLSIAGTTPAKVNATNLTALTNWDLVTVNVKDKNGVTISPTISQAGNTVDLSVAGTTGVQVNTGGQIGTIPNWDLIDIRLRDQFSNPIIPTSVSIAGSVITINENISSPGSGVAFQIAQGTQYTSYANFDEGWRMQNGWFDYVPPSAPLKRAYLDYTQGANSFYVLGEALTVGGVASTTRFVSVVGTQVFTGGTNRDKVLIDKLTGLMLYRVYDQGSAAWATALNNADAFSVTVDSTTYNDWYLISAAEAMAMFGNYRGSNWVDALTGVSLTVSWPNGYNHTATTYAEITTQATSYRTHSANGGGMYSNAKTNTYPQIFIRKCRNLIS